MFLLLFFLIAKLFSWREK